MTMFRFQLLEARGRSWMIAWASGGRAQGKSIPSCSVESVLHLGGIFELHMRLGVVALGFSVLASLETRTHGWYGSVWF